MIRGGVWLATFAALTAVACGSSGNGDPGTTVQKSCKPQSNVQKCSTLNSCADSNHDCWYEVTRDGSTQTFACGASCDCTMAAEQVVQFCS